MLASPLAPLLQIDHQLDTPAIVPGHAPPSLMPTVFRLGAHCDYSERYGLLGSVEQLGNWDPAKAVPMQVRWELVACICMQTVCIHGFIQVE